MIKIGRRKGIEAVGAIGSWAMAGEVEFGQQVVAVGTVFDESAGRAKRGAAVLAVGKLALARGEERRERGEAVQTIFDFRFLILDWGRKGWSDGDLEWWSGGRG